MMKRVSILFVALVAGCAEASAPLSMCGGPTLVDPDAPIVRIALRFEAGGAPLTPGAVAPVLGAEMRISKARLYLSELSLVDENGDTVAAELVDAHGARLAYDLALIDIERPESMELRVRAPAGRYRGLRAAVGVPARCASGETLNGADASLMDAPLDVDSDMYWSWNAGYVFLKLEGQVWDGERWDGFFYHVGGGDRFVSLEIRGSFVVDPDGDGRITLLADVESLFRSPDGMIAPDPGDAGQRRVHGGELADALARNLRSSAFLRLAPFQD